MEIDEVHDTIRSVGSANSWHSVVKELSLGFLLQRWALGSKGLFSACVSPGFENHFPRCFKMADLD
jgi:hypothetical protein